MSARLLRLGATVVLLGFIAWRLDLQAVRSEFADLEFAWLAAALALTVPQVVISAWRWRLTARRIGLELRLSEAIREYYLATFLNQLLPGGVLGDAARAWRHGRDQPEAGDAWHAVVIERVSGQLSLALVALIALACAPGLRIALFDRVPDLAELTWVLIAVIAALLATLAWYYRPAHGSRLRRFVGHARDNLLCTRIGLAQLFSSLLVVASYIAVFVLAGRALDIDTPLAELWVLVPPVLLAMALPLSVAGWGLREGAAALVWMLAGLPPSQGVAISLAYGLIVLVSSLPGAMVLAARRPRGRSRPAQPLPDA
ncbi:lysylphosphatidylglycerol synthase transmembrane domain-containing protein [Salinisphaera sp. T31B1]|uniref:lysylphosphatidylglycerol synthase transmembrane domain-containing protein n=1 Tax=Salinisphaera sp. T31B1 TaxID=727963 RepID=UPI00334241F5